MLAYDYPILGFFWTLLMVFIWVSWLIVVFRVVYDIFRNREMSGWGKAGWFLVVLIVPLIGVLIYVIVHGGDMAQRDVDEAQAQQAAVDEYIRQAAGTSGGVADELSKLAQLRDAGEITSEQFERQKARLLA